MRRVRARTAGFTMLELMVAIALIGVFASVLLDRLLQYLLGAIEISSHSVGGALLILNRTKLLVIEDAASSVGVESGGIFLRGSGVAPLDG